MDYFPAYSVGISVRWNNDGVRTDAQSENRLGYDAGHFLKLSRVGNDFSGWSSLDGISWTLNPNMPQTRDDLAGTLQVGLHHSMFTSNTGFNEFDDFSITADSFPPNNAASSPIPMNGSVDIGVGTNLRWKPGDNVQSTNGHKLYLSTSFADVNDRLVAPVTLSDANYDPPGNLLINTTYYWCVDEVNGATTWAGPVWNFSTSSYKATTPIPENFRGNISTTWPTLQWTQGGAEVVTQDVYFSLSFEDVNTGAIGAKIGSDITGDANSINIPGLPLAKGKTYFWRVDSKCGALGTVKGDVWRFSTAYPVTICDDFEEDHDYMVSGTTGTIWDGIIGTQYILGMATDVNDGYLRIEGSGTWAGRTGQGILLYKEIVGPFIARIEVTDYPGLWTPGHTGQVADASAGLMARVGDISAGEPPPPYTNTSEDWVINWFFPRWGNGNKGNLQGWYDGGTRQEFGIMGTGWNAGRYLEFEYAGDGIIFLRWSRDGLTYYTLNPSNQPTYRNHQITVNPLMMDNWTGLPLQVGPCYASYGNNIGYAEFDNFCLGRDLIAKAYSPLPTIGGNMDIMDGIISWAPGDWALSHDVYFGMDPNDVNDATPSDPEYRGPANVQGPDTSGRFSYDAGTLEGLIVGQTYYWRVDEVNASNPESPWKGPLWRFVVQDYSPIDDFERYSDTGYPRTATTLRNTWIDGYYQVTFPSTLPLDPTDGKSGSFVQLERTLRQNGAKAMKFNYDNGGTISWLIELYAADPKYTYVAPQYSEAVAAVDDAARLSTSHDSLGLRRDWTPYKVIRIPFYGDPANGAQPMYVGLRDGDGTMVTITHPDAYAAQRAGWQNWDIALSAFVAKDANLNLADIARIYIGFGNRDNPVSGGRGTVYFDDLVLLVNGICIPGSLAGDLSNNCTVNAYDLDLLLDYWLVTKATLPTPIIELDASGLPLGPLSSWTNTGSLGGVFSDFNVPDGNTPVVEMVDVGSNAKKAVTFDRLDLLLWNNMAPASLSGSNPWTVVAELWNLSVTDDEEYLCWARRGGGDGTYAAMGYGSNGSFGAAAHWGGPDIGWGSAGVPAAHTWHKVAITYKGGTSGTQYVIADGLIQNTENKTLAIRAGEPVVIGAPFNYQAGTGRLHTNWEPSFGQRYNGSIASIRVYDQYIDAYSLALLTGNRRNPYADNQVDFKDIAVLANNWLVGPVLLQ